MTALAVGSDLKFLSEVTGTSVFGFFMLRRLLSMVVCSTPFGTVPLKTLQHCLPIRLPTQGKQWSRDVDAKTGKLTRYIWTSRPY